MAKEIVVDTNGEISKILPKLFGFYLDVMSELLLMLLLSSSFTIRCKVDFMFASVCAKGKNS